MKPSHDEPQMPVVELADPSHQPSKAEMEEDVAIPEATPEDLARAVLRPVRVRHVPHQKA